MCRGVVRAKAGAILLGLLALASSLAFAQQDASPDPEAVARGLLQSFNRHDPAGMAATVSEDFQLFYVGDRGAELGLEGRNALVDEMKAYFSTFPDVASSVDSVTRSGSFVAWRETVRYTRDGSPHSQSSLAVYEIRNDRIARVWYYPAERTGR